MDVTDSTKPVMAFCRVPNDADCDIPFYRTSSGKPAHIETPDGHRIILPRFGARFYALRKTDDSYAVESVDFFFFFAPFYACVVGIQSEGMASPMQRRPLPGAYSGRAGRGLARMGNSPPSASSSGRSGMVSSPLTLPASGSSSREFAYARWAATASSSRTEVGWHGGCPLPGEQAQEGCSLAAKASTYLDADDNRPAAQGNDERDIILSTIPRQRRFCSCTPRHRPQP